MRQFKASNGVTIRPFLHEDSGSVKIFRRTGTDSLKSYGYLDEPDMQALREFFAQERCDDLPFRHGDYWVFPRAAEGEIDRWVLVVGPDGRDILLSEHYSRSTANPDDYCKAALTWFAANPKPEPKPEPKPWLDAQTGEVWSISDGDEGGLAVCQREPVGNGNDDHPYFYGPNFDGIRGDALTAGTRLEVQS